MMNNKRLSTPQGTDISAWAESIIASIPRYVVVNVDALKLADQRIRRKKGRRILSMVIAQTARNQSGSSIPSRTPSRIESMLDPAVVVMVPHHMARRIFDLSDDILNDMRRLEAIEYQQISSTYVYNWDMLRVEWLSDQRFSRYLNQNERQETSRATNFEKE